MSTASSTIDRSVDHRVPLPNSLCGAHMYSQGFGTWRGETEKVGAAVKLAIMNGYRVIDCARIYQNQEAVGEAISQCIKEGIVTRKDLYIVGKVWNTDHEPDVAVASAKLTTEQLKCDYLDLLLIHWPVAWVHPNGGDVRAQTEWFNYNEQGGSKMLDIPIIDTWKAMEALVDEGLVKDIGVSNFTIEEVDLLLSQCRYKPVANQVEVHPGVPNDELRQYCQSKGIVMMSYKPYGIDGTNIDGGLLHNKEIKAIAEAAGLPSGAHLLLQWNCQKGNVALCKSTTAERIKMNADVPASGLSDEVMEKVAAFSKANLKRLSNPVSFRAAKGPFFSD